jgi:hypothetical protein
MRWSALPRWNVDRLRQAVASLGFAEVVQSTHYYRKPSLADE